MNAELEELEQEELDERLLDVAGTAQLPSVPDTEMPVPAGKFIWEAFCLHIFKIFPYSCSLMAMMAHPLSLVENPKKALKPSNIFIHVCSQADHKLQLVTKVFWTVFKFLLFDKKSRIPLGYLPPPTLNNVAGLEKNILRP